ncbi:response regulator transcription factor [Hymenobacter yonginensis]|jgi:two-component system response regulator VanR|uniref:Response regulator transcription factor n=1 Tax=Hymenobacter yonginensis TaxID=748197 RepID=A0ABY7PV79_9BACT|nr:response regulator transcription factor [Hymenobacter yonginensis]WBO86733.1 response regulator transcription factor [Hymenobacter yonginensis]
MPPTVLIVDDEAEIRELVAIYLQSDGLHTLQAATGDEALQQLSAHSVQLVVLDIMLDETDGFDVCRRIREQYTMPVLFLSARQAEIDKIKALTLGGDDFITKPFGSLELLARVKAQLRRYLTYNAATPAAVVTIGELRIDTDLHQVTVAGQPVRLTPKEFEILLLLARNRGYVFSIEKIYETIWQQPYLVADNTVMVHIAHLRQKIEPEPRTPQYVKTVWGFGYKM